MFTVHTKCRRDHIESQGWGGRSGSALPSTVLTEWTLSEEGPEFHGDAWLSTASPWSDMCFLVGGRSRGVGSGIKNL